MERIKNIKKVGIKSGSRILAVFAHPDDETAFSAGLLKMAVNAGANIKLVCLTRGEKSTLRYGLGLDDKLDEVREVELSSAMQVMGISDLSLHRIPDGEVEEHLSEANEIILSERDAFKPDFILTFEPDGIYGHPDHMAVTKIVTEIFENEQCKCSLIYVTVSPNFKASAGARSMAKDPEKISPMEPEFVINLNLIQVLAKLRAFRAHGSQFKVNLGFIYEWCKNGCLFREYFKILRK